MLLEANPTHEIGEIAAAEEIVPEPPRPLMREMPPAEPFPVDALGDLLAPAARGIHDKTQAPLAICGQSVLAAATLAVQAHADVRLPTGQTRPLSGFFVSVAASGERKSAVDSLALSPVRKFEALLRERAASEKASHLNALDAFNAARDAIRKKLKGDHEKMKAALDALGPAPAAPLEPMMTCPEPTYEGLCKMLAVGWPSVGIFSAEGGQFVGGHGLSDEAKLRTAAGLSLLWDGEPIKRVRAGDGTLVLAGRRVSAHLMVQTDVGRVLLSDRVLSDQGFLSRTLVVAPDSTMGTRFWREPSREASFAVVRYEEQLFAILERPLPLAPGKQNELAPRTLPLHPDAATALTRFSDHVERQLGKGGGLAEISGLANKLPEHAARLAAVIALTRDIEAGEITRRDMESGIALAEHYAVEAQRLFGASRINGELALAQQLLDWILREWAEDAISLPDIYQRGPNAIRDARIAKRLVGILEENGWLIQIEDGAVVLGQRRRDAWRVVRG